MCRATPPPNCRYDLKAGNAILAEAKHLPLYEELVAKHKVDYIAGGATQNSIRVAQWIHGGKGFAAYIGAVGKDAYGADLKAAASADGVTTYYDEHADFPTGTCAVLIHDRERSLVANLAAAEHYSKSHFESDATQGVVKGAKVIYSAGFFLTHSHEVMVACGKKAAADNTIYAMNLSAPFLCQFFKTQMHAVLPFADFVFGNETEAAAFAENNGIASTDVEEIAKAIAALPKENTARPRHVVITQGAKATVCASSDGTVTVVATPAIPKESIVDTNGAGDSFVGGFLAMISKGADLKAAIDAGHFAAGHVIQRDGCTFDSSVKYVPAGAPAGGAAATA